MVETKPSQVSDAVLAESSYHAVFFQKEGTGAGNSKRQQIVEKVSWQLMVLDVLTNFSTIPSKDQGGAPGRAYNPRRN